MYIAVCFLLRSVHKHIAFGIKQPACGICRIISSLYGKAHRFCFSAALLKVYYAVLFRLSQRGIKRLLADAGVFSYIVQRASAPP